jgi:hypothetical protein
MQLCSLMVTSITWAQPGIWPKDGMFPYMRTSSNSHISRASNRTQHPTSELEVAWCPGPVNIGDRLRRLPNSFDSELPEMPGWKILHTPGHTPGHVSFFRTEDRSLIVGDAFCTTKPESFFEAAIAQKPELHGPPAYFTWNWNAARESVQRIAALNPLLAAPGHGKPLAAEGLPEELRRLSLQFDDVAIPENRRDSAAWMSGIQCMAQDGREGDN